MNEDLIRRVAQLESEVERLRTLETPTNAIGVRVIRDSASATQSIPNTTVTALTFDTTIYDTNSFFDVLTPTRLTCTLAGIYVITGAFRIDSNATGQRQIRITRNGADIIALENQLPVSTILTNIGITTQYQLAVNDYVEISVFQNSGGALNINNVDVFSPIFMMTKV